LYQTSFAMMILVLGILVVLPTLDKNLLRNFLV